MDMLQLQLTRLSMFNLLLTTLHPKDMLMVLTDKPPLDTPPMELTAMPTVDTMLTVLMPPMDTTTLVDTLPMMPRLLKLPTMANTETPELTLTIREPDTKRLTLTTRKPDNTQSSLITVLNLPATLPLTRPHTTMLELTLKPDTTNTDPTTSMQLNLMEFKLTKPLLMANMEADTNKCTSKDPDTHTNTKYHPDIRLKPNLLIWTGPTVTRLLLLIYYFLVVCKKNIKIIQ